MVAEWPIDRRRRSPGPCYFHLANLAEEHFRIRTLRVRDTGEEPLPESIAQAVKARRREGRRAGRGTAAAPRAHRAPDRGPQARGGHRDPADQRPAHHLQQLRGAPPSGPRPAGGWWRRSTCSGGPPSSAPPSSTRWTRSAPRWRPSTRRCSAWCRWSTARWTPRSAGATGTRPPLARAFIRYGSWIGGDRDGNPNVTAKVTREAVLIQAEHVLIALENAARRIGRSLTLGRPPRPRRS